MGGRAPYAWRINISLYSLTENANLVKHCIRFSLRTQFISLSRRQTSSVIGCKVNPNRTRVKRPTHVCVCVCVCPICNQIYYILYYILSIKQIKSNLTRGSNIQLDTIVVCVVVVVLKNLICYNCYNDIIIMPLLLMYLLYPLILPLFIYLNSVQQTGIRQPS